MWLLEYLPGTLQEQSKLGILDYRCCHEGTRNSPQERSTQEQSRPEEKEMGLPGRQGWERTRIWGQLQLQSQGTTLLPPSFSASLIRPIASVGLCG